MKTKSLTSLATLGVAVALNASAFAGPDPQLVPSILRSAPEQTVKEKGVPTIALVVHGKGLTSAKSAKVASATTVVVPGPHGDNQIYRR